MVIIIKWELRKLFAMLFFTEELKVMPEIKVDTGKDPVEMEMTQAW